MFAVVKTGGKQYKVAKNDVIKLEKVDGDAGAVILLEDVIALTNDKGEVTLGAEKLGKVSVAAEVLEQGKGDKVIVFKKKRRHNYRRKQGHRQFETVVRIQDIGEGLKAKAAPAEKPAAKKESAKPAEKKADAKPAAKKESEKTEKKAAAKKPAAKKETKKAEPKAKKDAKPAEKKDDSKE